MDRISETFRAVRLAGHYSCHAQVMKQEWRNVSSVKTYHYSEYRLKSYDTEVARIVFKDGEMIGAQVYGLYSSSTRRHLRWFFDNFMLNIPMDAIKVAAGNDTSRITFWDGAVFVLDTVGRTLWADCYPMDDKKRRKAVREATTAMKKKGTWNSFDSSDYVGRTRF